MSNKAVVSLATGLEDLGRPRRYRIGPADRDQRVGPADRDHRVGPADRAQN